MKTGVTTAGVSTNPCTPRKTGFTNLVVSTACVFEATIEWAATWVVVDRVDTVDPVDLAATWAFPIECHCPSATAAWPVEATWLAAALLTPAPM